MVKPAPIIESHYVFNVIHVLINNLTTTEMQLIINIIIRIFVICCIRSIEDVIAHSLILLLVRGAGIVKALTGQIEAIHDNPAPVILFI